MTKTIRYLLLCMLPAGTLYSQIGMNLAGVHDYGSQLIFVDLFKQSRPWICADRMGAPAGSGAGVFY